MRCPSSAEYWHNGESCIACSLRARYQSVETAILNEYAIVELESAYLEGLEQCRDRFAVGLGIECGARGWTLQRGVVRYAGSWFVPDTHRGSQCAGQSGGPWRRTKKIESGI